MKTISFFGLLLPQFILVASASALEYVSQVGEVTGIIDGDTFLIRFPNDRVSADTPYVANLIGVDAPGIGEVDCEANFVALQANKELLGKQVWVEWDSRDKQTRNGRLLVYISLVEDHSTDLNARFIEQGWGWVPRRYHADRKERYLELEKRARTEKKGIWGGPCAPSVADHEPR